MTHGAAPAPSGDTRPDGPRSGETHAEDTRFGGITVRLDTGAGTLEVEGRAVPRVALRRKPGGEVAGHVPIGTRDGTRLTLTVDGETVPVVPGKGRLLRRSYAVDVTCRGARYRLVPDSLDGSRLLKDGRRLGRLSSDGDGIVLAEWREGAEVEAVDAALGYALAAAFGTGGQPWWMMAADLVGILIPG
ncbi:hypothetical protein GCM10010420_08100 [Streptomyces glaucosporus]|uniref:Urease accessory protein UreD n=1 Tax=Streptomyces glaucosporus TaxID=284044 RepID=A0ABP5UU19_9ACTN